MAERRAGGRDLADRGFLHDRPPAAARAAWRDACRADRCPARVEEVVLAVADALGRVTSRPVVATRSSPSFDAAAMDGVAVRADETVGAADATPVRLPAGAWAVVDTG